MSDADTSSAVIEFLDLLADLELWIDGGWGVDALLGVQTRPHADLDIIVRASVLPVLLARLSAHRYSRTPADPLVFVSPSGLRVDIHQVEFDAAGYGVFDLGDGREWPLPPSAFSGSGTIGARRVRCLSAEAQVQCHAQGYAPQPKDIADMRALQERFHVVLPLQLAARAKPPRVT
jgi:lincosamide nucleotidyltransferase A/C/D/E